MGPQSVVTYTINFMKAYLLQTISIYYINIVRNNRFIHIKPYQTDLDYIK